MSISAPEHTPHVRSLDALRGLLAVLVVAAHACQIFSMPQTGLSFGFPARAAVLFFFCLSGYVIAMSIHGNIRRNGAFDVKEYALARFMRIAPPMLGIVALTVLFATVLNAADASRVDLKSAARPAFFAAPLEQIEALLTLTIFGDLTGRLVNGPVWSLIFEIQLYAIAGLSVLAWKLKGTRRTGVLILLIAYISVFGIVGLKLRTLTYLAFGFGAAAYALRRISRRTLMLGLIATTPVAAGFGAWATAVPMLLLDSSWVWISFQVALSAVFALLVLAASRTPFPYQISDYSYTLYILHFPLFLFTYFLMYRYWPDTLARWANPLTVVAVPLAVVAAAGVGRLEHLRLRARRKPQRAIVVPQRTELLREPADDAERRSP